MAAFEGWLIKFGNTVLPNELLALSGFNSTPNQRIEKSAKRNANQTLIRKTARATKTKMTFQTKDNLTLDEKIRIQNVINSGMINQLERKVNVTYWNDETNSYVTSATGFYISDVQFPIKSIKGNDIIYGSVKYTLVEY